MSFQRAYLVYGKQGKHYENTAMQKKACVNDKCWVNASKYLLNPANTEDRLSSFSPFLHIKQNDSHDVVRKILFKVGK